MPNEANGNESQETIVTQNGQEGQTDRTNETNGNEDSNNQTRTFTQDQVNEMVKSRLERERAKMQEEAMNKAREEMQNQQSEAIRLKDMNAKERQAYEIKKRDDRLAELEAKLNRQEMERQAMDMLSEKGINADSETLNMVVADTAEETKARIEKFDNLLTERALAANKDRFKKQTPTDKPAGEEVSEKEFGSMNYKERVQFKNANPERYNELIKNFM
ncbi:DUF4355 domain-containing protein [Ligilactobacillus equi]|uniref:DUF4355 domain-containing protein n=1 Tax=Ligilactobacillus equi DSM 15833 = JCM 10991 TaxID=1423740 RepID=A0A0R1TTF5_9LACO|nr:DUF4355 domain-containing protein [Ligilactobacillus equi]KRL81800.1 hypothetical protein FC36_GL001395 [Ligilactobacillus equi DSM 15833 = JCM 10991]